MNHDIFHDVNREQAIRIVEELWPVETAEVLLSTRWDIEQTISADLPPEEVRRRTAVMDALSRVAVVRSFAELQAPVGQISDLTPAWDSTLAWKQAVFRANEEKTGKG